MLFRLISSVALLVSALPVSAGQVRVVGSNGRWHLERDGQPYLVKGVGGDRALDLLVKSGGNSIRLWGDEKLGEELDAAQKLGLTVTAGIWLAQVRQGFDWTDADRLVKQREHVREVVQKYKNHPALLVWALGNEMEDTQGKNGAVWGGINNLARMVKEIDPNHPVMTVIAEIGGDKVKNIEALCPDVDILGINSYGGVTSLGERYRKLGGTKPFILSEYGPAGIWEIPKNALGAYPEKTSTEKAEIYRRAYQSVVLGHPELCLGSYAFLWGQKQEATATWFSMFLNDGSRLGAVDAIAELWSGKPPENRVPLLKSLKLESPAAAAPGSTVRVSLSVADPENDPLKVAWFLQRDAEEFGSGGDKEEVPPYYPEAVIRGDATGAEVRMPKDGGLYRLFATVYDAHGGAAVGNVALRVEGVASIAKGRRTELPLSLYAESTDQPSFVPAGWMGDAKSIRVEPASTEQPQAGATCMKCEFAAEKGWGGVVWQSPEGDWGDRGGGYDLTGAKKITFWARGAQGGEVVSFKYGIIPREKKFFDTGTGGLDRVTLGKVWQQYEMPVSGQDLSRIKTGFAWSVASSGQPVVFYLDNIRWE